MENVKCLGERCIACGAEEGVMCLEGTPGNALGAYLDGADIILHGNAQEATGDTMNAGSITVYGNTGDGTGYAMRGGEIYIKGNSGYRTGIHMKAYADKIPAVVIGNRCGNFLGEYQAGGFIIVLGLECGGESPVGSFCGVGMHGGRIYLRCKELPVDLPKQICASAATKEDMEMINVYIENFSQKFGYDKSEIENANFYVLTPNTKSPYKQLYVSN